MLQCPAEGLTEMHMDKPLLFLPAAVLFFASLAAAEQGSAPHSGAWSGIIVYSSCNADEASNESRECFISTPGAKFSLYDDTNRMMYGLEPQSLIGGHRGDTVTVRCTRPACKATSPSNL